MTYTLDQLAADCRAAMDKDSGPAGREEVRKCIAKACGDKEFVSSQFDGNTTPRQVIYEDDKHGFCILAHVYEGEKGSNPHDHADSWAIYGQAMGTTTMTDWEKVEPAKGDQPGKVRKVKDYDLTPGIAHLYNEGDLHSPYRASTTRLIRVEGKNLAGVARDKFEAVETA